MFYSLWYLSQNISNLRYFGRNTLRFKRRIKNLNNDVFWDTLGHSPYAMLYEHNHF